MTARADAHLHLFRDGFPGRYGRGPYGLGGEIGAYERFRAEHDIAAGLVVAYEADGIEPDNNAYVRELAATRPWIASVAYVAPNAAPEPDTVSALLARGHAGIALYLPDAQATAAVLAWPRASWRRLNASGAIVSLNARPEATAALAPLIATNGDCRFLFSHLGLPGRHAAAPTAAAAQARLAPLLDLARLPNALVKISGLYAVSDPPHAYPHDSAVPFLAALLERFGAARCCWGSDFSPALDHLCFAQTVDIPWVMALPAAARDMIMGGNLLRLLGRAGERV